MFKLENDMLVIEIAHHGAELKRMYHKGTNLEYLWDGDATYWGRTSPVLFPIVGRLNNHTYTLDGQTYSLSQHGFARDMMFTVMEQGADFATFTLQATEETLKKYPFLFELRITYKLVGNTVDVIWDVKNNGEERMYFSIGAHPAFCVPMTTGTTEKDYVLYFDHEEKVQTYSIEDGLVSSVEEISGMQPIAITPDYFQHDAVIYDNVNSISIGSEKHDHSVSVSFKGFPYVGIWSPYKNGEMAPFVCIEPWYGIADDVASNGDFTKKRGILSLQKEETFHSVYSISVK